MFRSQHFCWPRMVPVSYRDVPAWRADSYRLQHDGISRSWPNRRRGLRIGTLFVFVSGHGRCEFSCERFGRSFLAGRERRNSWAGWPADRHHHEARWDVHARIALAPDFVGGHDLCHGLAVYGNAHRQLGARWRVGGWISARQSVRRSCANERSRKNEGVFTGLVGGTGSPGKLCTYGAPLSRSAAHVNTRIRTARKPAPSRLSFLQATIFTRSGGG